MVWLRRSATASPAPPTGSPPHRTLALRIGRAGRQPGMVVEALSRRAALAPMLPAT